MALDHTKTQQLVDGFHTAYQFDMQRAAISNVWMDGGAKYEMLGQERLQLYDKYELVSTTAFYSHYDRTTGQFLQWGGKMTAAMPIFQIRPTEPDERKQASADIANGIFKFHIDEIWNLPTRMFGTALPSIFSGGQVYCFLYRARYTEPEYVIGMRFIPVFNLSIIGKFETSLKECSGVIIDDIFTVDELCVMFPDHTKKIKEVVKDKDHSGMKTREELYLNQFDGGVAAISNGMGLMDKELLVRLVYKNKDEEYPDGMVQLYIDGELLLEEDCPILPIEIWTSNSIPHYRPLKQPPMFSLIPAQAMINDIMNAIRAKSKIDANPPTYEFDGMQLSMDLDTFIAYDGPVTPGARIKIRPNMASGIPVEKQIPFQPSPGGNGIAMSALQLAEAAMGDSSQVNAELTQDVPSGASAELIKTINTIGNERLKPSQQCLEGCIFRTFKTAIELFQTVYDDKSKFTITNGKKTVMLGFNKEGFYTGMDFVLVSRIDQPTTKEARLTILAKTAALFPQVLQTVDKEELLDMVDLRGWGFDIGGRNVEIQLAEEENRQCLAGEGIYPVEPEQNHQLHIKKHARIFVSEEWHTISSKSKERLKKHQVQHLVQGWMVSKGKAALFGAVPPAEMERILSLTTGEITPEMYRQMEEADISPDEALAQQKPQPELAQAKTLPPVEGAGMLPRASGEPTTEPTTSPVTQPTIG